MEMVQQYHLMELLTYECNHAFGTGNGSISRSDGESYEGGFIDDNYNGHGVF